MRICPQCDNIIAGKKWQCAMCGWSPEFREGFPVLSSDIAGGFPDYPVGAHERRVHLEASSFWFLCRNQIILHGLTHYFQNAKNFLEIGCGTGFVLSGISLARPEMALFGAEAYLSALKHAKSRVNNAEYAQMDISKLPFVEEFDVVGAFDVLEHVEDDRNALRQIYRSIKPGGGMILTVPQHRWLWSAVDAQAGHKRRYESKELKNKITSAGFHVLFTTSFITVLLPFMLVSRQRTSRQFYLGKRKEVRAEVALPSRLNAMFKYFCSWEVRMIRRGLSLPLGGSLLCAAGK